MIQNLRIKGFKNFQDVELELGPLNLFVGANASGKSNLLEVLRIFQGIALGYRIDEIFDGKPKSARGDTWEGIRGGLANAGCFGQDLMSFGASGQAPIPFSYDVVISSNNGVVRTEKLTLDERVAFDGAGREGQPLLRPPWLLSNTVNFDPSPAILRLYSTPGAVGQMGEDGENFAALVKTILENPVDGPAYVSWLEDRSNKLICAAAEQEVEIWLLAGHADKLNMPWQTVWQNISVKEQVFAPFLAANGSPKRHGEGRDILMKQALENYQGMLQFNAVLN